MSDEDDYYDDYDDEDYDPESDMRVSGFPECCGAHIIHGFAHHPTKETLKATKDYLEKKVSAMGTGIYLLTLNEQQKPHYDAMLAELGFEKAIDNFYNPNSGNIVTLYGKAVVDKNVNEVLPKKNKTSVFQGATPD